MADKMVVHWVAQSAAQLVEHLVDETVVCWADETIARWAAQTVADLVDHSADEMVSLLVD